MYLKQQCYEQFNREKLVPSENIIDIIFTGVYYIIIVITIQLWESTISIIKIRTILWSRNNRVLNMDKPKLTHFLIRWLFIIAKRTLNSKLNEKYKY